MPHGDPGVVALSYVEALNSGSADRVADLVTEHFVNEHTSVLGSSLIGREAYRARLPLFLGAFEGLTYEVEDVIVDGQRVALPYTLRARCKGSDGQQRPVVIRGMFRLRVEGALVSHRVDYWDSRSYEDQVEGRI